MLFTSLSFFAFLAVVFVVFYLPPFRNVQTIVLVGASFFFYAYGQPYLLALLIFSALISEVTSHQVLHATSIEKKKIWVAAGVAVNLAVLGFFKYFNLLYISTFGAHGGQDELVRTLLALPLPIGISFYTFHGVSLLVDTFRMGRTVGLPLTNPEQPDWRYTANVFLYLTFFPQLIAGPIVKARFFFPQINPHAFRDINWPSVFQNLVIGYFLKTVIADNLQEFTSAIAYPYFLGIPSANLLILLFSYSVQIFADFAGYSLIAIGLAELFGYRLPTNFRFPYISETFSEFWTRWHISLSTWLREYLYIPLGGNRKGRLRTYLNLMIVMFLGGLWHGAAWSYAVWGTTHGVALACERILSESVFYKSRHMIIRAIRTLVVFGVVTFAWLLFKLPRFSDAVQYFLALKSNSGMPLQIGPALVVLLYCLPVIVYHALYLAHRSWPGLANDNRYGTATSALLGVMLFAVLLNAGPGTAFIYFQF